MTFKSIFTIQIFFHFEKLEYIIDSIKIIDQALFILEIECLKVASWFKKMSKLVA